MYVCVHMQDQMVAYVCLCVHMQDQMVTYVCLCVHMQDRMHAADEPWYWLNLSCAVGDIYTYFLGRCGSLIVHACVFNYIIHSVYE